MAVDLALALRTLNHELRTPNGVVQGYLKMMLDGRIDVAQQEAVLLQMQRAAGRIGVIGQQTSELLQWVSDRPDRQAVSCPVGALIRQLESRVPQHVDLLTAVSPQHLDRMVPTFDTDALVGSILTLMEIVSRRYGRRVTTGLGPNDDQAHVDVWVYPSPPDGDPGFTPPVVRRGPLVIDQGGLGLSVFVASAVVEAHGGWIWQQADGPMLGVTLPWRNDS